VRSRSPGPEPPLQVAVPASSPMTSLKNNLGLGAPGAKARTQRVRGKGAMPNETPLPMRQRDVGFRVLGVTCNAGDVRCPSVTRNAAGPPSAYTPRRLPGLTHLRPRFPWLRPRDIGRHGTSPLRYTSRAKRGAGGWPVHDQIGQREAVAFPSTASRRQFWTINCFRLRRVIFAPGQRLAAASNVAIAITRSPAPASCSSRICPSSFQRSTIYG
jgi:hypothetical protein